MSKLREKIFASMLVVPMVLSNIYLPVLGVEEGDITNENTEVSDSSKIATVSGKEENVYVNLNDDGSVDNVYVVNEILLAEFGKVTDFGNYSEVRNLSNSGEITNSENTINFDGTLGKNYYQGTLASKEIPWNISIKYFLDGNEIPAKDIIGKSGNVEIKINLTKNANVNQTFFENFLLQMTLSLDTENCTDIQAEGATVANVGSEKQLTYMIFAGEEKEISIKFNTTLFELKEGISINGVLMNLVLDSLDTTEITDKVDELSNAVSTLNNGAKNLKSGSKTFKDSLNTLNSGISGIPAGSTQIKDGINSALTGTKTIRASLSTGLNQSNNLEGIDNLIMEQINVALSQEPYASLIAANPQMLPVLQNLLEQTVVSTINTVSSTYNEQITNTVTNLSTALAQLEGGLTTLYNSYGEFDKGVNTLVSSVGSLNESYTQINNGISEIANGTNQMNGETENLGTNVENKINEMLDNFNNSDYQPVSFVSEQNSNVNAVQFVIKTKGLKVDEEKKEDEEAPRELSFWERFINLFK